MNRKHNLLCALWLRCRHVYFSFPFWISVFICSRADILTILKSGSEEDRKRDREETRRGGRRERVVIISLWFNYPSL